MARPRDPSIPSDWRECPVHGTVEHRGYTGHDGCKTWRCLECSRDYDMHYKRGEAGPHREPEPARPCCPTCWIELPASGECGECS